MPKSPKISDAEWVVMQVVWDRHPVTTNEVVDALRGSTEWKPKTIMTLLRRLVDKGALRFEKKGRSYEYHPLVEREQCIKAASRSFVDRIYGGSLAPMLAGFLREAALSDKDIEELRSILDERSDEDDSAT